MCPQINPGYSGAANQGNCKRVFCFLATLGFEVNPFRLFYIEPITRTTLPYPDFCHHKSLKRFKSHISDTIIGKRRKLAIWQRSGFWQHLLCDAVYCGTFGVPRELKFPLRAVHYSQTTEPKTPHRRNQPT